jgi:phospholipid/cholesterol/gamma-HCH transport system ATP-binding protein
VDLAPVRSSRHDPIFDAEPLDTGHRQAHAVVRHLKREQRPLVHRPPTLLVELGRELFQDRVQLFLGHAKVCDTLHAEPEEIAVPTPPQTNDIIVLEDVRKTFGKEQVLRGVSLTCRRGETTVVIGGSGAGKTTLLRLIVALEQPTSGRIVVEGEDIVGHSERDLNRIRRKFGMVYQYAALLDSITVLENVAFPLVEHTKLSRKEIEDRVVDKLRLLGLSPDVIHKFPAELSGGMRKRVGLARALMLEPPILVYDEPTSGLDPLTSRVVDDMIDEMRHKFNVTSLVISHDIASCFRIAHQAILLIRGEIVARGSPDELAQNGCDVAREFFAKSGVARAIRE